MLAYVFAIKEPYFHREISQEFFFALFLASREMEKAHKRYMNVPIHLSIIPGIFFWGGGGLGRRSGSWCIKTRKTWGWWYSSVIKNNGCSYRGPVFSSQHLHDGPQLSTTPIPGYGSVALFWIPQTLHTLYALVYMQQTITHTIKTNVKIKKINTIICGLLQLTKIKFIVV